MLPVPTTEAGRTGLAALLAEPTRSLVALDFDGTLAPIAARPQDSVPAPGAVEALVALSARGMRVLMLTGRPAQDVIDLGGLAVVPGLQVEGQYGAQRWVAGVFSSEEPLPGIAVLRGQLPDLLAAEGAELEDKAIALVVHTRNAPDPAGALLRLEGPLRDLAAAAGLEVHPGRFVLELRPPGVDKGRALLRVVDGASTVLFAGDDVGDLAAYDAVDVLRSRGIHGLTVYSASDEGPPLLRARADLVLPGPHGVVAFLQQLATA